MSKLKQEGKQCSMCKGFGLVKKEYTPCNICIKYNLTSCIQCENKKLLGLYQECNECLGCGAEKKTKSNNNNVA
jgi:hypothetical protein